MDTPKLKKQSAKQEKKEKLFTLSSIITFGGPLLIFLGVLRLMIYYKTFGIDILYFLDITEILTSFLDIVVINCVLLPFIFFLAGSKKYKNDRFKHLPDDLGFLKRLVIHFPPLVGIFIITGIGLVADFIVVDDKHQRLYSLILLTMVGSVFVTVVQTELKILRISGKVKGLTKKSISILVYFLTVLIAVGLWSYLDILTNKTHRSYDKVQIQLDDNSTIYCNENYYYIGKTNNYLFIHSETKKQTEVIPMTRVRGLVFSNAK